MLGMTAIVIARNGSCVSEGHSDSITFIAAGVSLNRCRKFELVALSATAYFLYWRRSNSCSLPYCPDCVQCKILFLEELGDDDWN